MSSGLFPNYYLQVWFSLPIRMFRRLNVYTTVQLLNSALYTVETVKTDPCFRYENETGEERDLVIAKIYPINNHMNGELSTRPFHWYGC